MYRRRRNVGSRPTGDDQSISPGAGNDAEMADHDQISQVSRRCSPRCITPVQPAPVAECSRPKRAKGQPKKTLSSAPSPIDVEDDDDDGLPAFNLTPKKEAKGFHVETIVWCKWRKDYWPALVKNINNRQRKMTVVFADLPCDERGKEYRFTVPFKRVVKFDGSEKSKKLMLAGLNGCKELKDAIDKVQNLFVKRVLGNLHVSPIQFLNNPIDNLLAEFRAEMNTEKMTTKRKLLGEGNDTQLNKDEHEEENEDEDQGPVENETNKATSDNEDNESNDSFEEFVPDPKADLDDRSDEEKAFSDSIIIVVKSPECIAHLLKIREGKLDSNRHRWFTNGNSVERSQLKYFKFHHLMSTKQFEATLHYLRKQIERLTTVSRFHLVNYALNVWLPEALIYGVHKVLNVSRERAEGSLLTGKLPRV